MTSQDVELAGQAKKPKNQRGLTTAQERRFKKQVAELMGRGVSRHRIAVAYHEKLCPEHRHRRRDDQLRLCKRMLRTWEQDQAFRDMVWDEAVARLDMDSPDILEGVAKKAKKGRVDAAKLALAVTRRHAPVEAQGGSANIQIVFATNVPRPEIVGPPPVAMSREVQAIARQARALPAGDEED